jgi:hypothetical protein
VLAFSYHEIKVLALRAFGNALMQAALKKDPVEAELLMQAESHYNMDLHGYAIVHFITCSNVDDAIRAIMQGLDMDEQRAKSIVTSAVSIGPRSLREDFDYLHSKGVAVFGRNCFILPPELRKDTPYDTAFRQLSPKAREIAITALEFSLKLGKKDLGFPFSPLTQQYMVAQLMREGTEKDFRMDALRCDSESVAHKRQMKNSALAARHFAQELGISLKRLKIVLREENPVKTKPAEKRTASSEFSLEHLETLGVVEKRDHGINALPTPSGSDYVIKR